MHVKYKKLMLSLVIGLALGVTSAGLAFTKPALARVATDPTPTCGDGSTLVPAQNGASAYCTCPAGKTVVIKDNNDSCQDSCPNGYSSGTDTAGTKYCYAPPSANGGSSCVADNATLCTTGVRDSATNPNTCNASSCDIVGTYINPAIKLMTILIGVLSAASIIFAGIQYSTSGGDPQKVTAAKSRIGKTVFALVAYGFLYGLLQFLVPGGLFHS